MFIRQLKKLWKEDIKSNSPGSFLWWHYGLLVVYDYLHITLPHYHHYAELSEGIELLKCLSDIFWLECVSNIRWVLSIILHAIYVVVCIQLTHFSYDDCENTCTWSFYYNQIGSMTHLPLFRFRSWHNGIHCMPFCTLMELTHWAEWRIYSSVN